VGGTTGSGKSELLQALVVGLASTHRPDDLCFVLVDYKGGAAFRDCARLPHNLGLVTDLDEHLTARALTSHTAELRGRERILAQAGAKDLEAYRRLGDTSGVDHPRLARLVIVVDEFKLLADELPGFVDGLVRIAAKGRSLGVHLVLATQRPAGIITGDMRANVSLRICLRVRDRADSDDVIDDPSASTLTDRTPGRAYLRAGDRQLVALQTAQVGGPVDESSVSRRIAVTVLPTPTSGVATRSAVDIVAGSGPSGAERGHDGGSGDPSEDVTELAAFVETARQVASSLGIATAPSPWLPPLPAWVGWNDLADRDEAADRDDHAAPAGRPDHAEPADRPGVADHAEPADRAARSGLNGPAREGTSHSPTSRSVPFGLVDLPHEQRQGVARWDPAVHGHLGIIGGSRSGRSTVVRTLVAGLASRFAPDEVHVHVLEGSGGPLSSLLELPHVGSVVSATETTLVRRVVDRLADDVLAVSGPRADLVVLVIDGWEAVEEALGSATGGAAGDALLRLIRDGAPRGLRVIVTGGRAVGCGRLSSLLDRRLVLPMPDPLDLTLVGLDPATARHLRTPGRAIDLTDGYELHVATLGSGPSHDEQVTAVRRLAASLNTSPDSTVSRLPWSIVPLPRRVSLGDVAAPLENAPAAHGASGDHQLVCLGVGGDDAAPVSIDVTGPGRWLLVVGPARSGRSNVLLVAARQLIARGRHVAVVAGRRSPLQSLAVEDGVLLLSPHDDRRFIELRRAHPDLAVLVDDAETLETSDLERALVECVGLVDQSGGLVWVSADSARANAAFRGLIPAVAQEGSGIVLCATGPTDGDCLQARPDWVGRAIPGRGNLVLDSHCLPIQVAWAERPEAAAVAVPASRHTAVGARSA
jgi:S-DNA-T family DNA segregation ATPase FtsK/SpoIIIE